MVGLAMALALGATNAADKDLGCAAIAWQGLARPESKNEAWNTPTKMAYMFFLGRLTAQDPQRDWVSLIAAKSKTFLAVPRAGSKPSDLPCAAVIEQIVPLPVEVAP
ncbi:MAG: hypothetical protein V4597_09080 [Pseudomonadota bacterium]